MTGNANEELGLAAGIGFGWAHEELEEEEKGKEGLANEGGSLVGDEDDKGDEEDKEDDDDGDDDEVDDEVEERA